MAHFRLKSIGIGGENRLSDKERGTYEHVCLKCDNDKDYRKLSGPISGFDVFSLKCLSKEDYHRTKWIVQELNKKYSKISNPTEGTISQDIVNLYGNYKKVKQMVKELKLNKSIMPEGI